jgi:transcriptional regulator with XRE-family HTH domain
MAKGSEDFSSAGLASQRLKDFLELLTQQGFTQAQIAAKAGLPPQYVSDIKRGRRPMTELVARRLGEGFDVDFQWLMGTSASMERPQPQSAAIPASSVLWLPLFSHPVEGQPRAHPKWDGSGIEIAGVAAAKLVLSKDPYILRFGHNDIQGHLRRGDLILISQVQSEDARIHVIRYRKKSYLARANKDGSWSRVANGNRLPSDCPVTGHCVGIVWSSLL